MWHQIYGRKPSEVQFGLGAFPVHVSAVYTSSGLQHRGQRRLVGAPSRSNYREQGRHPPLIRGDSQAPRLLLLLHIPEVATASLQPLSRPFRGGEVAAGSAASIGSDNRWGSDADLLLSV